MCSVEGNLSCNGPSPHKLTMLLSAGVATSLVTWIHQSIITQAPAASRDQIMYAVASLTIMTFGLETLTKHPWEGNKVKLGQITRVLDVGANSFVRHLWT